jgi:hypothetical protein
MAWSWRSLAITDEEIAHGHGGEASLRQEMFLEVLHDFVRMSALPVGMHHDHAAISDCSL